MKLQKHIKNDIDYKFVLIVSNKCNLRCKYCIDSIQQEHKNTCLTQHQARKTIEWILNEIHNLKLPTANIVFFGGEPLLNFSIICFIVNYVSKQSREYYKKISFDIVTNGTLFNQKISDFLIKNNINCSISVDGIKTSHDINRVYANGHGSFDSIWEKEFLIKKMIKKGIITNALITVTPKTVSNLLQNIKFLIEKKFPAISINFDLSPGLDWDESSLLTLNLQLQFIVEFIEKSIFLEKRLPLINPLASMLRYLILTESNERKREFTEGTRCGLGKHRIVIDTDGNLYPCTKIYSHPQLRDFFQFGTIEQGVQNETLIYWLRNMNPYVDTKFLCHKCDLRVICQTHCPAIATLHKNLYVPPVAMCRINHVIYNVVKPLYYKIRKNMYSDEAKMFLINL